MICFHKRWEYIYKPDEECKSLCRCMKCGKVKRKRLSDRKQGRYTYLWCNCNHDLISNSFLFKYFDEKKKLNVYVYKCIVCNTITLATYDVSIGAYVLAQYSKNDKEYNDILNMNK